VSQIETPYKLGYDIGIGVLKSSGDPKSVGVVGEITGVHNAPGTGGRYNYNEVRTTEELEEKLGISVNASGGVGLFSASVRFNFSRSCSIQKASICSLVTGVRESGFEQIDEPKLSAEAAKLVSDGDLETFHNRYGDTFVRGVSRGGQFFGFIRIDTVSEETKNEIYGKVSGTYGAFNAEASMTLEEIRKSGKATIYCDYLYEGGKVTIAAKSPTDLLTAYEQWINSVDEFARAYQVTVDDYAIAAGPEPPNAENLRHQQDVLKRCAKLRAEVADRLNLINYMLQPSHRKQFAFVDPPEGPDFPALLAGLALDLDVIAEAASHALEHPKQAVEPETYARTVKAPPLPAYALTLLPGNLPAHIGASTVVPNFIGQEREHVEKLAAEEHVALKWEFTGEPIFHAPRAVMEQDPTAGTEVAMGATVIVKTRSRIERVEPRLPLTDRTLRER
jgi:hypothetical protein